MFSLPVNCSLQLHWEGFQFIYTIMSLQMRLLPCKVTQGRACSKTYPPGLETLGGHVAPCLSELWSDVLQLHRMIMCKMPSFFFLHGGISNPAVTWVFRWYSTRLHFDGGGVGLAVWCFNWVSVSNDVLLPRPRQMEPGIWKQQPASLLHHVKYGQPRLHARQSQIKDCSAAESESSDWDVNTNPFCPCSVALSVVIVV